MTYNEWFCKDDTDVLEILDWDWFCLKPKNALLDLIFLSLLPHTPTLRNYLSHLIVFSQLHTHCQHVFRYVQMWIKLEHNSFSFATLRYHLKDEEKRGWIDGIKFLLFQRSLLNLFGIDVLLCIDACAKRSRYTDNNDYNSNF